jgi:hypothetical protein
MNGDGLNNVGCEASRHFRNKRRKYLKDKIKEPVTNSKNKNIRDEFKWGYQPKSSLVKDANGDVLAYFNKSYFSQVFSDHYVGDVRQIEIHTAEPLVPGPG